ncbi:Ubiquitin 3 binding protein But2, C-terminal [Lasallia pustulata]|uniref:Ubiquitin 3 binding protein But2, C-terminal n=1 Tax=Lasallia pustulata TaxID=136370 RepID=A0A1W5CXB8_9LECA|nr:Ubiquitin 3 binding protein But2, C-terminal [Lasallia pustulata]
MKTTVFATAALVATANALVARNSTCCFGLTASGAGPAAGAVGQLSDGQNRVGGGLTTASYCIDSTGAITDSTYITPLLTIPSRADKLTVPSGRGCITTPATSQFQCDLGAPSQSGFSIGCNGTVSLNSSSSFYECPTGDNNEYNIYVTPPAGQAGCVQISLAASNCYSGCTAPPAPATSAPSTSALLNSALSNSSPSTSAFSTSAVSTSSPCTSALFTSAPATSAPTTAAPATAAPATSAPTTSAPETCPTALTGSYQYPHLIVAMSSSTTTAAAGTSHNGTSRNGTSYNGASYNGTSYNGAITPTISSIFKFDIPASYANQTCSLIFFLPLTSQLETSAYTLSGSGAIDFALLSGAATQNTGYANAPAVATDYGVTTVAPGGSYTIATFACPAGTSMAFELKSSGGTSLNYFQDYNPAPIGLYITSC